MIRVYGFDIVHKDGHTTGIVETCASSELRAQKRVMRMGRRTKLYGEGDRLDLLSVKDYADSDAAVLDSDLFEFHHWLDAGSEDPKMEVFLKAVRKYYHAMMSMLGSFSPKPERLSELMDECEDLVDEGAAAFVQAPARTERNL